LIAYYIATASFLFLYNRYEFTHSAFLGTDSKICYNWKLRW